MDTEIAVALIAAGSLVASAWLTRPSRQTRKAVHRIAGEFEKNSGSTAKDAWDRIEAAQNHLIGRFDQHLTDSAADKEAAHKEAIRMWAAIEAVAQAEPPMRRRP